MINIPVKCPSCLSKLERVKDQLFCRNTECSAKTSKVIESFTKKVKIKGLGPASINKLNLTNINDIYELTEEYLLDTLGKNGGKVFAEINNKRNLELSLFLGSLSIPLMGKTTAEKITTNITDITFKSLRNDGIGEKAADNLVYWLSINTLPKNISFTDKVLNDETDIKVCISGKIPGYTKASLTKDLLDYNVKVVSSVTKDIDYLISQEKLSVKAQKAIKLNIEIVTIDELKERL